MNRNQNFQAIWEQEEWGNFKVAQLLREALSDDEKDELAELETRGSLNLD
jgi:hypothetical protein